MFNQQVPGQGQRESRYPPIPDLVMAFSLALLTSFWGDVLVGYSGSGPSWLASVVASLGLTLPLAFRRTHPRAMLATMTVAGIMHLLFVAGPTLSLIGVPLAAYSYARWAGINSRLVLKIGTVASLLGPLKWTSASQLNMTVFVLLVFACAGSVAAAYLAGRRILEAEQAERDRIEASLQRYQAQLAQREQSSRISEARIRAEIARELHDVVAHSLSVIIVQADGGRALATKKPEAAAEALGTISATGREALTEMRRIVGVLRNDPGDEHAEYVPNPGLADIGAMVNRAGTRAELVVNGTAPVVPQTLGLTVYRVVQEAVTNVLKHAGPDAVAQVRIDYEATHIWLQILDEGVGTEAANDGQGHGLRGMQERVAAMGGRLVTGPGPEGGFLVQAVLPVPSDPAQRTARNSAPSASAPRTRSGYVPL